MQRTLLEEANTIEMLKNYKTSGTEICTPLCGHYDSLCGPCISCHVPVEIKPHENWVLRLCL